MPVFFKQMKTIKTTLEDKLRALGITSYELAKRSNVNYQTIDSYYKNKVIRYDKEILLKICIALDCEIGDILKIV